MIKAVIFDCFGVLVGKGFEQTYRMAGGDPVHDRAFIENTLGKANLGLINDNEFRTAMARQVGISPTHWRQAVKTAELLNTDLLTYIAELHRSYKTAILSNANRGVLERKIGNQWLEENFDEVVVSAEVGLVKPNPQMYKLVIDRLGVEPHECLYIDDRGSFLDVASQLGMSVLLYENFDQIKHAITAKLH
jgi:epoxide hydrolase-like predicted phosphatase